MVRPTYEFVQRYLVRICDSRSLMYGSIGLMSIATIISFVKLRKIQKERAFKKKEQGHVAT